MDAYLLRQSNNTSETAIPESEAAD
jgi:hypothetical protein